MAPYQATFDLVPNGPPTAAQLAGGLVPAQPSNKPAMTTKQAQKLYRQANKAPRMTKAEQRRHERQEQERIRKEFEREKASAKAKAARERKKAKDEAVRIDKRRRGEPIVGVRPSQGKIDMFVRRPKVVPRRPAATESCREEETGQEEEQEMEMEATNNHATPSIPNARSLETNAQTQVQATPNSGTVSSTAAEAKSSSPKMQPPPGRVPFQELPVNIRHGESTKHGLSERSTGKAALPAVIGLPPVPHCRRAATAGVGDRPGSKSVQGHPPRHNISAPKSIINPTKSNVQRSHTSCPSSTQLFVLDHVDDIFPSSTQQALELLAEDDDDDDFLSEPPPSDTPTNPVVTREQSTGGNAVGKRESSLATSRLPVPTADKPPADDFLFFSTQDLVLSSQDVRELEESTVISNDELSKACEGATRLSPIREEEESLQGVVASPLSIAEMDAQLGTPRQHCSSNDKTTGDSTARHRSRQWSSPALPTPKPRPSPTPSTRRKRRVEEIEECEEQTLTSSSPLKKRFFTSSGSANMYVAMQTSLREFQREQRMRELERQAEENSRRAAERQQAARQQAEERKRRLQQATNVQRAAAAAPAKGSGQPNIPGVNKGQHSETPKQRTGQGPAPIPTSIIQTGHGEATTKVAMDKTNKDCHETATCASQETDYGDLEFEDYNAVLLGITEEDLVLNDDDL